MEGRNRPSKTVFTEKVENVESITFSPDNRTLVSWGRDSIHLWNVETGNRKTTLTEKVENVESITFSPDNRTLVSWGRDSIHLWDVETGNRKTTLTEKIENVKSVTFSPTGCTLISESASSHYSNSSHIIRLWDVETGKRKTIPTAEGEPTRKPILLSSDNRTLISVSTEERDYRNKKGIIHLSDVEMDHPEITFAQEGMGIIKSVHLSSDNRMLISVSKDNTDRYSSREYDAVRLWDIETGTCQANLTENQYHVQSVHLSSDHCTLISVSDNSIHLWNVETDTRKATLTEGLSNIKSILLSSDNRTLISVSEDNTDRHSSSKDDTIHFWDVETGKCKATFTEAIGKVMSIDFVPGDHTLIGVSGGDQNTPMATLVTSFIFGMWKPVNRKQILRFPQFCM